MPGEPRNVGGIRRRSPQRRPESSHYLTAREAAQIAARGREIDAAHGIHRTMHYTSPKLRRLDKEKELAAAKARAAQKLPRGKKRDAVTRSPISDPRSPK